MATHPRAGLEPLDSKVPYNHASLKQSSEGAAFWRKPESKRKSSTCHPVDLAILCVAVSPETLVFLRAFSLNKCQGIRPPLPASATCPSSQYVIGHSTAATVLPCGCRPTAATRPPYTRRAIRTRATVAVTISVVSRAQRGLLREQPGWTVKHRWRPFHRNCLCRRCHRQRDCHRRRRSIRPDDDNTHEPLGDAGSMVVAVAALTVLATTAAAASATHWGSWASLHHNVVNNGGKVMVFQRAFVESAAAGQTDSV